MALWLIRSLALLCLTAAAASLAAQTSTRDLAWGASVGVAFQSTRLDGHLAGRGPIVSASVRRPAADRLSLILEALGAYFPESANHILSAPCSPTGCGEAEARPVGSVIVGGLIGGIQWADSSVTSVSRGTYVLLGGGLYRALKHPRGQGATRLGWTAGLGFTVNQLSPHLSIEVRFHRVPGWPEDRLDLIPIALALTW
jgi:hypothetical protein